MRKMVTLVFLLVAIAVILIPTVIVISYKLPVDEVSQMDAKEGERVISVYFHNTNETVEVPLEGYLVGVVAAEMPASFEAEALKAQAIAARTYALKKVELCAGDARHPGASICTNPNHCQAWISKQTMKARWGMFGYLTNLKRIQQAVAETKGQVITYQGRLIDPVYHSTGTGKTENSEDVWHNSIPYLRSVQSPWDEQSPRFSESKSISISQIDAALGTNLQAIPVAALGTGGSNAIIKVVERTSSGRIRRLQIDGKTVLGTEFRRVLGLNSTDFSWSIKGEKLIFTTKGFGHGVGMSQYGANGMAKLGAGYEQILKHYYTGVKLERID